MQEIEIFSVTVQRFYIDTNGHHQQMVDNAPLVGLYKSLERAMEIVREYCSIWTDVPSFGYKVEHHKKCADFEYCAVVGNHSGPVSAYTVHKHFITV